MNSEVTNDEKMNQTNNPSKTLPDHSGGSTRYDHTEEELDIIRELVSMEPNDSRLPSVPCSTDEIPAGAYNATIKSASSAQSKQGKHDVVTLEVLLIDPPYRGCTITKYYHHRTKKAVNFFKREMDGIGVTIANRYQLTHIDELLVGLNVMVQVVDHENGNRVIYLKSKRASGATTDVDPDSLW